MGLIRALRNRGIAVAAAKVGPDYIDPHFHEAASGKPCVNLDLWAMGATTCKALLASAADGNDVVVVEGVMGLFDGPLGAKGSTADLAATLALPVVLVVDTSHQAQSIGALVHGFATYRPDVNIAGVILNRVKSARHSTILREGMKHVPVMGEVRHSDSAILPSRHLGLVQAQEIQGLESVIEEIALAVSCETLVDKLISTATEISTQTPTIALPPLGQHIAIARDDAFSFIYPHILQGWRASGATLSFFSPLADETPSAHADAVYLPGGYPELHAGRLASNDRMMVALRQSTATIYGECGGYMLLGQQLTDAHGKVHRMTELLPHSTSFATRKLHLGYRSLKPSGGPWARPLRGHEFHYSTQIDQTIGNALFHAFDAAGNDLGPTGTKLGKVMGSYAHLISEAP